MNDEKRAKGGIRRVTASDLLGDEREIVIVHDGHDYRLRLTSNNKLILTK